MTKLAGTFSKFQRRRVLVVGDLMLDSYTVGKTRRISPEAPVPVLNVQREEYRPGGAGNVMLNLLSLGCDVTAMGRIGNDKAGERLCQVLSEEGVSTDGVYKQEGAVTPVKNRVIADSQQIVRVDREEVKETTAEVQEQMISSLPSLLEGVDIVAISDYAKGTLSPALMQAVIAAAKKRKLAVIVDPKAVDFSKYDGATVVKPNFSEALRASGLEPDSSLDEIASSILERSSIDYLMVTRSESGISLFHKGSERSDFPVKAKDVKDVTGAGDTVLATLTCAIANGLTMSQAVQLSNFAAGLAIERFGCARITLPELARRLLEDNSENKLFGQEHLFALEEALKGKSFSLVVVETKEELDLSLFAELQQLKKEGDVVLYVADEEPNPILVNLLASLEQVGFIILKDKSLDALCERLQPNKIVDSRLLELVSS